LHDRGILAALKGVLSASDFVLESVVETAKTPEAVRSVRNVFLLTKMLGSIEPEVLEQLIDSVPEGLAKASAPRQETPGLFSLVHKLTSQESRRGLAVAAEILETFGKRLAAKSTAGQDG
jgi:uncharacterized protein YjgD (DUF1641 family)